MIVFRYLLFTLLFFFGLFCSSVENKYAVLAENLKPKDHSIKKKIAVFPFENADKKETGEGRIIAEKLTHELLKTGEFTLIERSRIDRILSEQSLDAKGVTSVSESIRIGKLLSAEGIVVGSVLREGQSKTILARLVDTSSGEILSSSQVVIEDSEKKNPSPIIKNSASNSSFQNLDRVKKPEGKLIEIFHFKKGNIGRWVGLLKNTGEVPIEGKRISLHLKDAGNKTLDTFPCFTQKPVEVGEESVFSCFVKDLPKGFVNYEFEFFPDNVFLSSYTNKLSVTDTRFTKDTSFMDSYHFGGTIKNDSDSAVKYPKIILALYDDKNKLIGEANGYSNKTKLAPGETSSFKITIYSFGVGGEPVKYKVQFHALAD